MRPRFSKFFPIICASVAFALGATVSEAQTLKLTPVRMLADSHNAEPDGSPRRTLPSCSHH